MTYSSRYESLNSSQQAAVDHIDGPVMVIAGPGTGKTELLSMRAANILRSTDTLPENILCLTFTDSGATAMRERLTQIIGSDAYKVAIHTFHSFGGETIAQNNQFFYNGATFSAADELTMYAILTEIFDTLPHSSSLTSKNNDEYTHLNDTVTVISELKRSGLLYDEILAIINANEQVMDSIEPALQAIFATRTSIKMLPQLEQAAADFSQQNTPPSPLKNVPSLHTIILHSLNTAIIAASETQKPTALTQWRNTWMEKNDAGDHVFKSRKKQQKLRDICIIYKEYLLRMQHAQLYDFDDMILRVAQAMELFPELRFNLQEKYQYIMVDEFQDTNMAQMRILTNLTNNEANAGKPNILVVGDDDQAIYSFQGAEVGNIMSFRSLFPAHRLIALVDNYRSANVILSHARNVITKGGERLEQYIPELNKTLTAHKTSSNASVSLTELQTKQDEFSWIAADIQQKIDAGVQPNSIAVLARRHHELIALLPYFAHATIDVSYERRDNILELESIVLLEQVATAISAIASQQLDVANSLLPQIIAHPAFGYSSQDIWELSVQTYNNRTSWLEHMQTTSRFAPFHAWLIAQAQLSLTVPLERSIDAIIGDPQQTATQNEDEFQSPLYNFFFSEEKRQDDPNTYLAHLEALRTLRTKLREYKPGEQLYLQDFVAFVTLHRKKGSTIMSVRPNAERKNAIHLMTAHKAKGLEFDHVYITGAVDTNWGERVRSRNRLISYPENLPLAPAGDTFNERLRLFFVAMTRAKQQLTISYSLSDANGKATTHASFLLGEPWQPNIVQPLSHSDAEQSAQLAWYTPITQPITQDMKLLLQPFLQTYKLSATHVNNFVDISRGGPQAFLMNNILRFPKALAPQASYGTAIHQTLQQAHSHVIVSGAPKTINESIADFIANLSTMRLTTTEQAYYTQKGSDALRAFLQSKQSTFNGNQRVEVSFAHQGVVVGDARLTGSLDLVETQNKNLIITDYKTGNPIASWKGKADYEKIKLHKFRQQLMFYELLVRHARDYRNVTVTNHVIQFVEPTKSGQILSLEAQFSEEDLANFATLIKAIWQRIMALDFPDTTKFDATYNGIIAFETSLIDEIK